MPLFLFRETEVVRAMRKIPDGSTIAISGFNISTAPEYLMLKLYDSYNKSGHPRHLFIESDSLPGAPGRGIDYIIRKLQESEDHDFLDGVLMPFLGWSKWLQKIVEGNEVEGYSCSIGTVAHLFREMSAGRPGLLTKVGMETFLDPEHEGGMLNDKARERKRVTSTRVNLKGEDYLFVTAPKPTISFIRGTTADAMGNVSMEKEGIYGTVFTIAQAAKACPGRGKVFCQVERIARSGTINPKAVHVPGPLIDYVIVAPSEYAWQTGSIEFDPRISGGLIPPKSKMKRTDRKPNTRSVIQKRAALEVVRRVREERRPIIANFGVGIPSEVPGVLEYERVSDFVYATVEAGPWGGIPLSGNDFGVSVGPFAIIPLPDQFTLYEGGMIDVAVLGFMQVGQNGDVNPSMLPGRMMGPGGFPAISTGSPSTVFAGTFTAGKSSISVENGALRIKEDGEVPKFVEKVYKTFFSGRGAVAGKKDITYITERAVFKLQSNGPVLIEVAPGIDLDRDVMDKMGFRPKVSEDLKTMDKTLFLSRQMGLHPMVSGTPRGVLR